ncbi:hypothetical protein [Sphingomonas sp. NFR15]|uniref:hypothetical protein n=1 Tax=Sphingomonas sp. NFR15 TaxID=1566282 RepID=UPI00087F5086|nr:hypothetical protein [Sphingomonas sp. NFR15]SDA21770.1 hypothetical protein SAMN03159340_01494 [Sphingomonas sp. NFR15]
MKSGEITTTPEGEQRHPWDWYVEQAWVTERLCDVVDLESDVHYLDPTCGLCTIPQVLANRGMTAFGTDIVQRTDSSLFLAEHDFLGAQMLLIERCHPLSIVMNPPFSYQDGKLVRGLAEKFVRRALQISTHKVAALLPIKWLASSGRVSLFRDFPPSIYVLAERPSMPPGDRIDQLGPRRAWKGGKVDYAWFVWDKRGPRVEHARTFWIPPRPKARAQAERRLAA